MGMQYNQPGVTASTIGNQLRTDYFQKKALVEIKKEQYFSQLADVTAMPKNMGKTIKRYQYLPMLNDANLNDQGIDAAGAAIVSTTYEVILPRLVQTYAVQANADAAVTATNAVAAGVAVKSGAGPWTVTNSKVIITNLVKTTSGLAAAVVAA